METRPIYILSMREKSDLGMLRHELNLIPSFLLRFAMAELRESSQGSIKDTESMDHTGIK